MTEPLRTPEELATLDELPLPEVLRILALSTIDNPDGLYTLTDFRRERKRLDTITATPDQSILDALHSRRQKQIHWTASRGKNWNRPNR